ncbi:hypothetical protein NPX13_g7604 [Xylaria arbuscula]|uniref:Uncharacterized protein n=1 Tax=Xylaria arbuscula TaxID=114810 RepID=A0A9W8NAL0_9PEZI|nr:hypothetical protein NPX13_g7604 [Xylaria arbuscula]
MDLSQRAVEEVVHPTAAFLRASGGVARLYSESAAPQPSWDDSLLNPKNRIDSLELPGSPLWRVDGVHWVGDAVLCRPHMPSERPADADGRFHTGGPTSADPRAARSPQGIPYQGCRATLEARHH